MRRTGFDYGSVEQSRALISGRAWDGFWEVLVAPVETGGLSCSTEPHQFVVVHSSRGTRG